MMRRLLDVLAFLAGCIVFLFIYAAACHAG